MLKKTYIVYLACLLTSCAQNNSINEPLTAVITPVQTVTIAQAPLNTYTELTAVSSYQEKSFIKANTNGYVQRVNVAMGKEVFRGSLLFSLISKEARAIGDAVNKLDPGFKFSGVSVIRADQPGFIVSLNHQKGDYVQDGETLGVICNLQSFVFLLDLPYELHRAIDKVQQLELILPDGEQLSGKISGALVSVDSLAQTQRMVVKVNAKHIIPEGLIAKVRLITASSPHAQVLPKSAILTNEMQDQFWVMKLINDSTAVKVLVKKGIENDQFIEVLNPLFKASERIISQGNYGIGDTAKVRVVKTL